MPEPTQPWEARLRDAAQRIEADLRSVLKTVDEEVIPEVRQHSSSALRKLAEKLGKLADHMDDARNSR